MHSLPKLFLAALSFTILVDGSHRCDWIFAIGPNPTGGNVIYQGQSDAQAKRLAYVDDCDNSFILAVDSTSTVAAGGQHASVRITSQKSYNGGLFIFDASYMPVGEIDIVEGVNNQGTNQMTLYTGTNQTCTNEMTNSTYQFSGKIIATDRYSTTHADSGCSIEDTDTSSFAYGFNNAEGGVFALLWDNSPGMSIWHFARALITWPSTNKVTEARKHARSHPSTCTTRYNGGVKPSNIHTTSSGPSQTTVRYIREQLLQIGSSKSRVNGLHLKLTSCVPMSLSVLRVLWRAISENCQGGPARFVNEDVGKRDQSWNIMYEVMIGLRTKGSSLA
ncbi:uncharacterized protein HD556DRAFT_1484526 [Suillus plorans]|uniref:Uncharacterized protein n=1 Tax=Suillus plorans TaxID=116603 RepID=A0A9P7DVB2_9AGAM|nr:uncharacterized protein HD556DRAFT_1484526 [Suillus plorans]KAG1803910.1 hypothetical protein HD556DRAFT_1484526 [Suillus plorans]